MTPNLSTDQQPLSNSAQELRTLILRFVLSRVRNSAVAEDLTQDIMIKGAARLPSLREASKIQAWFFQIARNTVMDYFRRSRPTEEFDDAHHGGNEQQHPGMENEELRLRESLAAYVRGVVERLPLIYRDALLATDYEGLSQRELAERLGLSLSAAKSRVQRARALAKAEMESCCRWDADVYGHIVGIEKRTTKACSCEKKGSSGEAKSC